jgi:hypothetical protein
VESDNRTCERCGALFVPRREHARFCSAGCREAWNRKHTSAVSTYLGRVPAPPDAVLESVNVSGQPTSDLAAGACALRWSIAAMTETTGRLARVALWDRHRGFALVGEAVWWATIVDATLVRHHPQAYDDVLAAQVPAERQRIEQTLAGLRFVRNRIGADYDLTAFIKPAARGNWRDNDRITAWTWRPVPGPALASLSPRGVAWEMTRYRA